MAASFSISALITRENSPKVRMVIGNEMIRRIVPIVAFTSPITSAAIKATVKLETMNPGIKRDISSSVTAIRIQ